MQVHEKQGLEPKAPYAIGGERDVRVRAVAAVSAVERAVHEMERQLKAIRAIGRLRLQYDRRENRFRWRWWEAPKRARPMGARLSWEQLRGLRDSTKSKVWAVQQLLEARRAGMTVLQLAQWAMATGVDWQEQTVTLRWSRGDRRRATWGFLLSGGMMRRGNVGPMDAVESGHAEAVNRINIGPHEAWRGEITAGVEYIVQDLQRIDESLTNAKQALRRWLRLYYSIASDTWQFRQIWGPRRSRYVSQEVLTRLMGKVTEHERGVLEQARLVMERRWRMKRLLHVLATLGEAAQRWPGGVWQLRGEQGGEKSSAWVATVADHGVSVIDHGVTVGQGWGGEEGQVGKRSTWRNELEDRTGDGVEYCINAGL